MTDHLSPHFTLAEMVFSQKALRLGIDNTPPPGAITYMEQLCALLLEPARQMLGVPIHIDSGYRCAAINADVGGDPHSAHMEGRAADCKFIGMPLREAFDALRSNGLPYDRIIIECDAWIHLAIAQTGSAPRRVAETAKAGSRPGSWEYQLVA